jgi:hypothetical protein
MQEAGHTYRPKTNRKAERFIQTSLGEWAYARAYNTSNERAAELPTPVISNTNQQTRSNREQSVEPPHLSSWCRFQFHHQAFVRKQLHGTFDCVQWTIETRRHQDLSSAMPMPAAGLA